jgi:hypothetical protein
VIRQENLHGTRVIPLDGRPHVASAIRSWTGDPRGSWSSDVLIVDSTNFTDLGDRFDENLHLVERSSRIDSETLLYEFTVDDPTVYTRPRRVVWPLKRSAGPLFEEACHEGITRFPVCSVPSGCRKRADDALNGLTAPFLLRLTLRIERRSPQVRRYRRRSWT